MFAEASRCLGKRIIRLISRSSLLGFLDIAAEGERELSLEYFLETFSTCGDITSRECYQVLLA